MISPSVMAKRYIKAKWFGSKEIIFPVSFSADLTADLFSPENFYWRNSSILCTHICCQIWRKICQMSLRPVNSVKHKNPDYWFSSRPAIYTARRTWITPILIYRGWPCAISHIMSFPSSLSILKIIPQIPLVLQAEYDKVFGRCFAAPQNFCLTLKQVKMMTRRYKQRLPYSIWLKTRKS